MTCEKACAARERVCVCVLGGEGSWVFASTIMVVLTNLVWMAMLQWLHWLQ